MKAYLKKILTTKWSRLQNCFDNIEDGKYPGVYILAYSSKNLEGRSININDIYYVGMSNARGGVKSRLKQFINGIENNKSHSAGKRFYREIAHDTRYSKLKTKNKFFFSIITLHCEVNKNIRTPKDLRIMGEVARLEYYLLAHIKEKSKSKSEPKLNKK